MPVNGRNKGAAGEREASQFLDRLCAGYGYGHITTERNLEQARGGGHDLNGIPGLSIEVKRVEALNVPAWWKQCLRQADAIGAHPLLMYRQNRKPWTFKTLLMGSFYSEKPSAYSFEVTLDEAQFKKWFACFLHHNVGKL